MASAIPILEPSASLRDVIFARNAAQESQQFLAATMVDTGKRIAAEIGLNAAKNEAAKLAPMLQMRYLDAYNDIAGGNTAQGLAKTMSIGAEVSSNPFLQRIAEQGNTLAAQMAQQKEIMDRAMLQESAQTERQSIAIGQRQEEMGANINLDLLDAEVAAEETLLKQIDAAQQQNAKRAAMGQPPLDLTQLEQQLQVTRSKIESYKSKLEAPTIPFGPASMGDPDAEAAASLPTDGSPSFGPDATQSEIIQEPPATPVQQAPAQGSQPTAMTPVSQGSPIQFTIYGTENPDVVSRLGGQFVFEATPEAKAEIGNKKTLEEMYATATSDKAKLAETPEYKSIYEAFKILESNKPLQDVAVALGGIENMDFGLTQFDADGKQFALTAPGSKEQLSGPRAPNGTKTPIIVTDKEKEPLLDFVATVAKARKGDAIPLGGKWTMKFDPTGTTTVGDAGASFQKDQPDVPNPEWGDRLPPNITEEDVAKMLTDVGVPQNVIPQLMDGAKSVVRNAFDKITGDGWDSAAADALATDVEGGPKKIMEAAKGPLIESLKGIKGIKAEATSKGEAKKTAFEQALSAESPAPSWIKDIGPAITDTLKAAGDSFQIATNGTRAWQDYQTVKDKFQNGLISKELYNEAMKELEARWEEIGSEVPFSELENKTNPLLKIGLLKKKQG